jgi:hypothetical protein
MTGRTALPNLVISLIGTEEILNHSPGELKTDAQET